MLRTRTAATSGPEAGGDLEWVDVCTEYGAGEKLAVRRLGLAGVRPVSMVPRTLSGGDSARPRFQWSLTTPKHSHSRPSRLLLPVESLLLPVKSLII